MADTIMQIGVVLFFVLFLQLIFIFALFIISLFKKPKYTKSFTPSITILIPTYNESKNIGKCLENIFATRYGNDAISKNAKMQIIVIDDGSTDDTKQIAKSYKGVQVLKQSHKGKVAALNLGTKHATHEFIISIDADTNVSKNLFVELLKPFADKTVGAVSGAVLVENRNGFFGNFQVLEYSYNNLIRASFSRVFSTGIWFFGCLGGYRKSVLKQIGGFKTDTMAEDMDVAVETYQAGYKAINVPTAVGYTVVPTNFNELVKQRARWWGGGLQTIQKHASLLTKKSNFAIKYLFYNHLWWAFYAFLSMPLFIYQIHYWWPASSIISEVFAYLFRWFSFAGPVYTLYMNANGSWAWSAYNIFGILSGVISAIMLIGALIIAKEKKWLKNSICIFFYFPYTIILNVIMMGSVIRFFSQKRRYFIK